MATSSIYLVNWQIGKLLAQDYPGEAVAVNDIGSPAYLADLRLLDMWGLGSYDVMRLRRTSQWTTAAMRQVTAAHGVRVAVVREPWFRDFGGLPPEWIKVGEWTVSPQTFTDGDVTCFYALDGESALRLRRHLREFAPQLPAEVIQSGSYQQPD